MELWTSDNHLIEFAVYTWVREDLQVGGGWT
jgi:hypothetical protein